MASTYQRNRFNAQGQRLNADGTVYVNPIAEAQTTSYRVQLEDALTEKPAGIQSYVTVKGGKMGPGGDSKQQPLIKDAAAWLKTLDKLFADATDIRPVRSSGERIDRLVMADGSIYLVDQPSRNVADRQRKGLAPFVHEFLYAAQNAVAASS